MTAILIFMSIWMMFIPAPASPNNGNAFAKKQLAYKRVKSAKLEKATLVSEKFAQLGIEMTKAEIFIRVFKLEQENGSLGHYRWNRA